MVDMTFLCKMINKIKLGKNNNKPAAAAIPWPATVLAEPVSVERKNAKVRLVSSLMKSVDVDVSFQIIWNAKIPTVAKAGLMIGKMILKKISISEAPSIFAASM